jgi:uncharacterized protein (DUF433 family)/DNA-binding transcriptional MerR regulator
MAELLAFSAEHVHRVTGLSLRQLAYWDETGFFTPRYVEDVPHRPFGRIYSFKDVVNLRVIAILRNTYRVLLQDLREVGARLAQCPETSWATLTLYVAGGRVFFDDPVTGVRMAARPPGQTAMPIAMSRVVDEMRAAAAKLLERGTDQIGKVWKNRYVAHNAPVLSGTRVPTSAIWNFHQAGYTVEAIISEYPRLTEPDVAAAIEFEERRSQAKAG